MVHPAFRLPVGALACAASGGLPPFAARSRDPNLNAEGVARSGLEPVGGGQPVVAAIYLWAVKVDALPKQSCVNSFPAFLHCPCPNGWISGESAHRSWLLQAMLRLVRHSPDSVRLGLISRRGAELALLGRVLTDGTQRETRTGWLAWVSTRCSGCLQKLLRPRRPWRPC